MTERYDRRLVARESTGYERVAGLTVGLALLSVCLAAATLLGALEIDSTLGGVSVLAWHGVVLAGIGVTIVALGLVSRADLVGTRPDATGGLGGGVLVGAVWFVLGGSVGAGVGGLGPLAWVTLAPLLGIGSVVLSVVAREDVAVMLPVGALLSLAGMTVAVGLIGPGWTWSPTSLSVRFPAAFLVPVGAAAGAVIAGWAGGQAYEGFGARGRQTGAYLVIGLGVATVLALLVGLVLYIAGRGLAPVLENLRVGAATGVTAGGVILLLLGRPAGVPPADTGSLALVRRVLGWVGVGAVGLVVLGCLVALALGVTLTIGAVTITPAARVGTGVALVALAVALVVAWRHTDGVRPDEREYPFPSWVRTGLVGGGLVLVAVASWSTLTPGRDLFVGVLLTPVVAVLAVAMASYPVVAAFGRRPWRRDRRESRLGPALAVGIPGGLGYLSLAVLLEATSGVVPVALPAIPVVGGVAGVSAAAQAIALLWGLLAVAELVRARGVADNRSGHWTVLLVGVIAALLLLVLHAVATFNELVVLGRFTVSPLGAMDWPFLMNPSQGLGIQRGVMPAVLGTVWLVAGAVAMAVPLGVGAAIYLTEYASDGLLTSTFEVATNGLWSTPSIVFGLFGLAFIVPRFGNSQSIFAGQLVLGFMLLPLVLITSQEAIRAVPDEYRDASAALGVRKWETVRSVVVPAAMPGVVTGVILGIGRIAGETAPILLVTRGANFPTRGPDVLGSFQASFSLAPPFVNVTNPALLDAASALPLQLFAVITAGVGGNEAFAWGTALVLLSVVLSFYAVGITARRYFRRRLH